MNKKTQEDIKYLKTLDRNALSLMLDIHYESLIKEIKERVKFIELIKKVYKETKW
jgi:hypothetical protein